MPATLRTLLARPDTGLRLVQGPSEDGDLDRAVLWAHSTDLPDPSPWVEPGQLLLTNGAQFAADDGDAAFHTYAARLAAAGVGGLAFATEVIHDTIPRPLITACADVGLPLCEVVDRTPFIVTIRAVAEAVAADQRERLEWSLTAHRALARAALRPDGLASVLRELERQLKCWVLLFDAAGDIVPVPTLIETPADVLGPVRSSVRTVLQRGQRAGMRITAAGGDVTLQTLGQHDRLRGVLAVGTAGPLDAAETDLITSVIALASISVEQSRALDSVRSDLRSGLLELMLAGSAELVRPALERLGDTIPAEPIRVAVLPLEVAAATARHDLERRAAAAGRGWFVAERAGDIVVLLAAEDLALLAEVLDRHGLRAGASAPGPWSDLDRLLIEADRARQRGARSQAVTAFEAMYGQGLLGLLDDRGAVEVARRLIEPLEQHPEPEMLVRTMQVWLRHGCAWDPAARELGIHRHTLRNRAQTVERLLEMDLSTFAARAELWLAIQLTT